MSDGLDWSFKISCIKVEYVLPYGGIPNDDVLKTLYGDVKKNRTNTITFNNLDESQSLANS